VTGLPLPDNTARARYTEQILELVNLSPRAVSGFPLTSASQPTTDSALNFWTTPRNPSEALPATWDSILDALRRSTVVSSLAAVASYGHGELLTWSREPDDAWRGFFLANPEPVKLRSFLVRYQDAVFLTWWTRHVVWHLNIVASEMNEEDLLLEIAGRFSKHEKVQAVYQQSYEDETQITVAIDTQRYEPELLERLLEDEYEIRQLAGARVMSFTYPPTGVVPRQDIVHPKARLLYLK